MLKIACSVFAGAVAYITFWSSFGAEIRVPQDQPTIQSAIDAASNGDVVRIFPGSYVENLVVSNRGIALTSLDPDDPAIVASTVISPAISGSPCIYLKSGPPCLVTGLSLGGGPVWIQSGSTLFRNNIHGPVTAGVDYKSGPLITIANNTVSYSVHILWPCALIGNLISTTAGSIDALKRGPVLIAGNTIENCGIEAWPQDGDVQIIGNTLRWPSAPASKCVMVGTGGLLTNNTLIGLRVEDYGAQVIGNTVAGYALPYGAAIWCGGSSVFLKGNIVSDNASWGIKGWGNFFAANNIIMNNTGWGAYLVSPYGGIFAGNLVAANYTGASLGISSSGSVCAFKNTIVGNRTGGLGLNQGIVANNLIYDNYRGILTVGWRQVIVRDNLMGKVEVIDNGGQMVWGPGNIDADPLFVDPGHWDGDTFILGDYHLLPGSPCIDAGANDVDNPDTPEVETLPATDIAGLPRIIDGNLDGTATVDIGAYEYLPGDVNYDGKVNVLDLLIVRNSLGRDPASSIEARKADVNADGTVNVEDLLVVRGQLAR